MKKRLEAPENSAKLLVDFRAVMYSSYYWAKNKCDKDNRADMECGIMFRFFDKLHLAHTYANTNRIFICVDDKESKRKDIYPAYKGKRKKDELLVSFFPFFDYVAEEILPKMGFKNIVKAPGLEADDIIASICAKENKLPLVIFSEDADLYQCLKYNVSMMSVMRSTAANASIMDVARFRRIWGIEPEQWIDVKSIAGCATDNVPGIKGVGEKTAIKYLKGELTRGLKYICISNGGDTIDFTRRLVKIPFDGEVLDIKYTPEEFNKSGIAEVASKYGLFRTFEDPFWVNFFGLEDA